MATSRMTRQVVVAGACEGAGTMVQTHVAGLPARSLRRRVELMLVVRLVGFAMFQGVIVMVFAVGGSNDPWAASVPWWPIVAILTNAVVLTLLVVMLRREGLRWWDLFRIDTSQIRVDLVMGLGLAVLSTVLVLVPNIALGTLLFGDAQAALEILVQPLPLWAAIITLVVFPVSMGLTELPTYFGYVQPRLEWLTGRAWPAVALTAGFLSLQHATLPVVLQWRFVLWRALMFLPFALLLGVVLRWRPRLMPYLVVFHGLADLQIAVMVLAVSR